MINSKFVHKHIENTVNLFNIKHTSKYVSLYSATMNSDLGLFSQYLTYIWSRLSWNRKNETSKQTWTSSCQDIYQYKEWKLKTS